jgi:hypothetical protein
MVGGRGWPRGDDIAAMLLNRGAIADIAPDRAAVANNGRCP